MLNKDEQLDFESASLQLSSALPKPRSFAEVARRRVEELEILLDKFDFLKGLSSNDIADPTLLQNKELNVDDKGFEKILRYFSWLRQQNLLLDGKQESLALENKFSKKKIGTKEKRGQYESRNKRGFAYTAYKNSSSVSFSNIFSQENFFPVKAGRYDLSKCLKLVIEVYCNKLDPDLFWLSRERVEEVLRSSENSLLKYLIIDASLQLSSLKQEDKAEIAFLHQNVPYLISSCYKKPSLDNVVALVFLALEEWLKYNIVEAKMMLGKAFRLADLLRVNPDFREESEFNPKSPEMVRKEKLWESLLLLHGHIFIELPGPPLGKCSPKYFFSHVGNSEMSFPTISRVFEVPDSEKIQVARIFSEINSEFLSDNSQSSSTFEIEPLSLKRRTVSGLNLRIYMESVQIYMRLYQFSLEIQHIYFANPYKLEASQFFLPESQRSFFNMHLIHMLQNLPSYFKRPQLLTVCSLWAEFTPDVSQSQHSSPLGNLVYIILLSCLIANNYPFIWFDPQPLSLPDSSWAPALMGSDAMFSFFLTFSSLLQNTKQSDFLIFNLSDALSAVYTYLNAILNCSSLTNQYKRVLFNRAQTIVDEIKLLSEQEHQLRHNDAKKVLDTLSVGLDNFNMPIEYKLTI